MKIFYLIFFFILGTVIGSFLCVVGLRLPKNIDFVKGKSRCDACGHKLHFYELIPIFSYIFLRGRCLKCHKKIDSIIPISEILGGLLFSTAYYLFGFSYNLVIALLIAALFIIIVTTDVTYYIIPDEIIITFSILFLIVEFLSGGIKNVGMHLLTGILLFIIMYLIMLLGEKLFKKESLGGGDVKLLFLFGLVLDPLLGIFTIFLGSLIALPISIFILYKEKNNMIPFGPFLLLAFMLIYYSGITSEQIINLLI